MQSSTITQKVSLSKFEYFSFTSGLAPGILYLHNSIDASTFGKMSIYSLFQLWIDICNSGMILDSLNVQGNVMLMCGGHDL